MKRRFVTFEASFPDDSQLSETGDVLVPAGRAIAERLAKQLASTTPCERHSHYGWAFSASDCWCLLQYPEPWLLMIEDRAPLLDRVFRPGRAARRFEAFLTELSKAFASDTRFSKLTWFTREEYERLGTPDHRD